MEMKNRTDRLLLWGAALSALLYGVIFAAFLQYGGNGSEAPWLVLLFRQLNLWLTLGFHAVPFLCLQLLLCRRTRPWLAALPSGAVAAAALGCLYGWYTATGWDTLGWFLLLCGCAAPAAGCALAWAVYGLGRLRERGRRCG